MNTAARDRALLPTVKDVLGRTPVSKLKLTKEKDGSLKVAPAHQPPEQRAHGDQALTQALKEQIGEDRTVTLQVVPEARAVAKFVRTSPRKARLVIDAIKGKRVSEALADAALYPEPCRRIDQQGADLRRRERAGRLGRGRRRAEDRQHPRRRRPEPEAGPRARPGPRLPHPEAHQPPDGHPDGSACAGPPAPASAPAKPKATKAPVAPKVEKNVGRAQSWKRSVETRPLPKHAAVQDARRRPSDDPSRKKRRRHGFRRAREAAASRARSGQRRRAAQPGRITVTRTRLTRNA